LLLDVAAWFKFTILIKRPFSKPYLPDAFIVPSVHSTDNKPYYAVIKYYLLGLHSAKAVQYIRPEIIGFILGSFAFALAGREFKPTGGSSPILRFIIAFFVMIGALVFLGCPLRMVLRMAAGDLNAYVGFAGFAAGIGVGTIFLKKGFSLGRAYSQPKTNGYVMPAIAVVLLVLLLVSPAFISFSSEGPGSLQAPILLALACGLVIGVLAQKSRMCMAGGIRDIILIKNPNLLLGYAAIFVVVFAGNLLRGNVNFSFEGQPIAHTDFLWNFLGMSLTGLGSVLLGGCPLRQVIMSGEGNTDAGICVLGMLTGAAFAHNFGLASSADGSTPAGQAAVIIGLAVMVIIAVANIQKRGGQVA